MIEEARHQYCITCQYQVERKDGYATYSNAKAKSGCFAPGLVAIRDRDHCAEHVGLHQFDSTEGLVSLLNVVVAVVAMFAVCWKVKESS